MHAWLSDDRVRQWYGGGERPTRQSIMEKYRLRIHGEPSVCPMLVFTDDGTPLGYVQWYSLGENRYGIDDTDKTFGIDLFIGLPDHWGKGWGVKILDAMCRFLFEEKQARRIIIDPLTTNIRAIRAYRKSGFREWKTVPRSQKHGGEWRDTLVMVRTRSDSECLGSQG